MRIDINQKKISLRSQYNIFVDGKESYGAIKAFFTFLSVINLSNRNANSPSISIRQKFSWFRTTYEIVRNGQPRIMFTTKSLWKPHYVCKTGDAVYEIFAHRGRKYSIFRNNIQIAFWDKEAVTWFEGDNYMIEMDDDADKELIISFCLILDNSKSNDQDRTVTYDFGNLLEKKPFDPDWRPNHANQ